MIKSKLAPFISASVLISMLANGCGFEPKFNPYTPEGLTNAMLNASLTTPNSVIRKAGQSDDLFKTIHGRSCANASKAVGDDNNGSIEYGIALDENIQIPDGMSATVIQNGWHLRYAHEDHEIAGLASAIVGVKRTGNELTWKAVGALGDKGGDDAYGWCYYYTVLMWKQSIFEHHAHIRDTDINAAHTFLNESSELSSGNDAHISDTKTAFGLNSNHVAVLPRGFGSAWDSTTFIAEDNHLLQFSFKYGDTEIDYIDEGVYHVFWDLESVFRDEGKYKDHLVAELMSVMYGPSVRLIQPQFQIFSKGAEGRCCGRRGIFYETVVVDNVPFEYAVPVLTGWDLRDKDKDIHIKDIGVWIESFDYNKTPGASVGTMTYTMGSIFNDKGGRFSSSGFAKPRYQVSILGLDNTPGTDIPDNVLD